MSSPGWSAQPRLQQSSFSPTRSNGSYHPEYEESRYGPSGHAYNNFEYASPQPFSSGYTNYDRDVERNRRPFRGDSEASVARRSPPRSPQRETAILGDDTGDEEDAEVSVMRQRRPSEIRNGLVWGTRQNCGLAPYFRCGDADPFFFWGWLLAMV
ncbi:unnamed protein product, partial [Mesorhabditis spiculigera]